MVELRQVYQPEGQPARESLLLGDQPRLNVADGGCARLDLVLAKCLRRGLGEEADRRVGKHHVGAQGRS
jgi:hypothetical protein